MKASELMICDWIKYGNEYFQVDGYHRISNTLFLKYNGHTARYKDGCVVVEDSEPIPLTEEILVMNGFKCRKTYACPRYSYIDDKGHKLISFLRDTNGYEMQVGGHRVRLHYVHELQRVLRCCGLFDLADNFKVTSDGVTTHTSEQNITD